MSSKHRSVKRLLPVLALSAIASLMLVGVAAGSASAATQNWYSCQHGEGSGFIYVLPTCTGEKSKTGSYNWIKLTSAKEVKMSSSTNFTMAVPVGGGVSINLNCTALQNTGTIENHGVGSGTFSQSGSHLVLSGCTVTSPAGCTVQNPVELVQLKGVATESEGKSAVTFSAVSGEALATIQISNCGILNGGHTILGGLTGISLSSSSSLQFTSASSTLHTSWGAGSFIGTSKIETSAGEALMVAP